jgi:hypothetical protein
LFWTLLVRVALLSSCHRHPTHSASSNGPTVHYHSQWKVSQTLNPSVFLRSKSLMTHLLLWSFHYRPNLCRDPRSLIDDAHSRDKAIIVRSNDDFQSFLHSIHSHEYADVEDDADDDDDSIADGHDFFHEYMVNFTNSNYRRLGLSMP